MNKQIRSRPAVARPVDPDSLIDDPHVALARLRRETSVVQIGPNQCLVLRAEHVLSLLTDPRTRQIEGREYVAVKQVPDGVLARFLTDLFLFSNDAEHRAKRGLFARSFAHRAIRDRRADVRAVADGIVASLPRDEDFDFVDAMAARVPAEMTAAILGLPRSDTARFAQLVYTISRALTPVYPHAEHDAIEAAARALFDYVEEQLRSRMLAPRDDMLTALLSDWWDASDMTFESLVFQIIGLIIGGSDTTRSAFGMLIALLLARPYDWLALRGQRTLIPGAVAEGMRYEPSVGSIPRMATASIDIGGVVLPAGTVLNLSTLSAMRDEDLYADPEHFNIHRVDHPRLHLVFGLGPHRCVGELLARIEMEESLAAILDAAPGIELLAPVRMRGFGGIRQITPMPVRIR